MSAFVKCCVRRLIGLSIVGSLALAAAWAELPAAAILPGAPLAARWATLGAEQLPELTRDLPVWEKGVAAQSGAAAFLLRKLDGSGFATPFGLYAGNAHYSGPHAERVVEGALTAQEAKAIRPEHFANLGVYEVSTTQPLGGLKSVALVIRTTGLPPSPAATPCELIERLFPATLSWNGGKQTLKASVRRTISQGNGQGFPWEVYALEWDLSAAGEPITAFRIEWRSYPHSCITALKVEQSREALPQAR